MVDEAAPRGLGRIPGRVWFLAFAILLVGVTIAVVSRYKSSAPERARSIGARLELAAGDVTVTEAQAPPRKEISGTPLATGARVGAGKGARALVRTADGAAVLLRAETEIALEEHAVVLERGELWLDAPRVDGQAIACHLGKHQVTASDAGLSVRRSGDDAVVYVARGLAVLSSPGGRVEIAAGEEAMAKGADAPKVSPVAFWADWTGGMGDTRPARGKVGTGSGRIYGMSPLAAPGAPALKLGIAQQKVRAVLRDGIAETEVDQTFSNPSGETLEGWFWLTLPPAATVTSFALETNGQLVEGEVVEKKEAAARYAAAVRQAYDPALLEWVDGRTYRARIYPMPPSGTRRVVLRYMELLPQVDGKLRYVYPLRSDDPVRFDEFSLAVDLGEAGAQMKLATSLDATVEQSGRLVTMRRSGYVPRSDFQLELAGGAERGPVRAWRFESGSGQADYLMLRYAPDQKFAELPPTKGEVVVVVDTSAGGDEGARQQRVAAAEAILRALADEDRFALVAVDVSPTVLYPKEGLAPATAGDIAKALERLSEHTVSGATDLGSMFEPALERLHNGEQPAVVYVGDGIATSGETGFDALRERLRRSFAGSRARFFAVGVGPDARHELLAELARTGGGQYMRIDEPDQTTGQALRLATAIKTPTITDVEVDLGAVLDQPFSSASGKLSRGEELVLLARTHHALPRTVHVRGRLGGKPLASDYVLTVESSIVTSLVPRFWAAEYVRRLLGSASADENRAKVLELGVDYGLMTPFTSILALDSETSYAQQGVQRRRTRLRGVRLTSIDGERTERELAAPFAAPRSAMGCDKGTSSERAPSTDMPAGKPAEMSRTAPASPAANEEPTYAGQGGAVAQATAAATAPGAGAPQPYATRPASDDEAEKRDKSAEPSPPSDLPGLMRGANGAGGATPLPSPPRGDDQARRTVGARPVPIPGPAALQKAGGRPMPPPRPPPMPTTIAAPTSNTNTALGYLDANRRAQLAIARRPLERCSDAASRPLAERIVLWQKRIRRAAQPVDLVVQYEAARAACELPDWRDQAALLDLVQARVDTEGAAETVLGHFAGEPEAARFVARRVLRRTVDVRLAAAVSRSLFGNTVDWERIDRELLDVDKPERRLEKLREAMLVAPGDPSGDVRLVRLLVEVGQRQEALAHGRRLRDRGFLTPTLAQHLGDVLAEAGERDEALRTYSEVVEFDAQNPLSRRVLGDVYLRQGWYAAAYRQYRTLTDLDAKSPLAWLRLAAAAAGTGRIDEALRIERDVSGAEGSPGPDDPRYWARLRSAARLGLLFASPPPSAGEGARESIARKLKELQLFSGPGTLALLTWEDLEATLVLVPNADRKGPSLGETTDAGSIGLFAQLTSSEAWNRGDWAVRWKSRVSRPVKAAVVVLAWNGKSFDVSVKRVELKPSALDVTL